MAETSFPFDNASVIEAGWRRMARLWVPDHVAQAAATGAGLNNLAVSQRGAGANLSVDVASGQGWLNGHFYQSTAVNNLSIAANSSGSARVDRIVVRLDTSANTIVGAVLQGTPGAGAPALTQAIDGTWEISLAQIAVANGAASIVTGNITDERVRGNGIPLTLPGAITAYRLVGGTATGAPVAGTFAVNDVVFAADGAIWICTVAGTPGTWVSSSAAGGAASTAATAAVATSEATTSTSYVDLTTPGPAVTVTTRTKALVIVSGYLTGAVSNAPHMGVAVSGATTIAAADADALRAPPSATAPIRASVAVLVTLTAGSNVFTAKYKSSAGGSVSFEGRSIIVIPTN